MTRTEILDRYHHLREISRMHHHNAMKFPAGSAIKDQAGRLGLLRGRTIMAEAESEITLAFDLAIYTSRDGRSTALDRYARAAKLAPGSDEALVLNAMRHARFSFWRILRRHEAAGLIVRDLLREKEEWLVDQNMEDSAPDGTVFAARLYEPESFSMSSGVIVPASTDMLGQVMHNVHGWRHQTPEHVAQDPRLATAVYRSAILTGTMTGVAFEEAGSAGAALKGGGRG